jgi:hypothetical protein
MFREGVEPQEQTRWSQFRARWNELRPTVRWIIYAVVLGWIPILLVGFLPFNRDELAGFGLGWGLWITIPCSLVAGVLIIYELIRFVVTTVRGE